MAPLRATKHRPHLRFRRHIGCLHIAGQAPQIYGVVAFLKQSSHVNGKSHEMRVEGKLEELAEIIHYVEFQDAPSRFQDNTIGHKTFASERRADQLFSAGHRAESGF
jgi:hypothetical protein